MYYKFVFKKVIILMIIIFAVVLYYYIPYKNVVSINEYLKLNCNKEIIICSYILTTGPSWKVIGDKNGYFKNNTKKEMIILEGNVPDKELKDYFFVNSNNKFIFNGKFLESRDEFGAKGEYFKVFYVDKWDILDSIDRGDSIMYFKPKNKLVRNDFKLCK